jgi:CubicO group peptidase (beta-lactamase class C family)
LTTTTALAARRFLVMTLVLSLGVVAACAGSGSGAQAGAAPNRTPAPVPGAQWKTVAPAKVGLDATKLDELAKLAEQGKSNCLLVARDGKIAGEWYFRGTGPDTAQDVFSVTKSVSSTLVGIAQDDGDLRITDSSSKWIPEWRNTPADAVKVRDVLSNDSGRQWSLAVDYLQLIRAPDRTAFAVGLQQTSAPGTVWAYNNSAIQTLQPVLEGATKGDVATFAEQRLFKPLGMEDTQITKDRAGNAQMFEGMRSTCRDMARFGMLFLNRGQWGEKRIVSSKWVAAATGKSSTKLNAAYGYLWWVNRKGTIAGPLAATSISGAADQTRTKGRIQPDAPHNMFWALGLGNQVVQVDPGTKTVVVRLGTAEARPTPPTFGRADAVRVVTEAVTKPSK